MMPAHSDSRGLKRTEEDKKRRSSDRHEPEIMYQYWSAAGGKVTEAMRLAQDAGEDRVPPKRQTWSKYAEQHNFAERLKQDEEKRWQEFHAERVRKQQHVLDEIVHTFEGVMHVFCKTLQKDVEALHSGDPKRAQEAEKRLTKLLGSMEAVDRFFRMHFRALGQPERITQDTGKNSGSSAVSYDDLEKEDNWAKSVDEVRDESGKT